MINTDIIIIDVSITDGHVLNINLHVTKYREYLYFF
jgi:hypothetical protein